MRPRQSKRAIYAVPEPLCIKVPYKISPPHRKALPTICFRAVRYYTVILVVYSLRRTRVELKNSKIPHILPQRPKQHSRKVTSHGRQKRQCICKRVGWRVICCVGKLYASLNRSILSLSFMLNTMTWIGPAFLFCLSYRMLAYRPSVDMHWMHTPKRVCWGSFWAYNTPVKYSNHNKTL